MPTPYQKDIAECAKTAAAAIKISEPLIYQDLGIHWGGSDNGNRLGVDLLLAKEIGIREYDRCMKKKGYDR